MKKLKIFAAVAVVSTLAAGIAAFGGCSNSGGSAGEEVDAEGWASAFNISNFYNFTAEANLKSDSYTGSLIDKVAYATDENGYITDGYYYGYEGYSDGDTCTVYEEITDGSNLISIFNNGNGSWRVNVDTTIANSTLSVSYAYGNTSYFGVGYYYVRSLENRFSSFTYNGSAYVYDEYTVKINNGHVSYIKYADTYYSLEVNYSSYGSTTVTIPSDLQSYFE